jgi:hypothetical protein
MRVIDEWIAQLTAGGVAGVDQYKQKLRPNADNPSGLADLLFEARAALMFRNNGWRVTLRESPDLQIVLG